MNWYLVILLIIFAVSHSLSFYAAAKDKTKTEAIFTAIILSIFWWLFYMAGIFTLL